MRRTISSVWMAAARQIIWKLLAIIGIMAAVELGLLWFVLYHPGTIHFSCFAGDGCGMWMDAAKWYWIFSAAFLLLTVVLARQGCNSRGKLQYTLRRLPVSEAAITTHWSLVHLGSYVVLWMAQLAVVLIGWWVYRGSSHSLTEGSWLELFVEFHLDGFLHGLLPIGCFACWIRQILWILCMGTGTAWFGFQQRRGKVAFGLPNAAVIGVMTFRSNVRTGEDLAVFVTLVYLLMVLNNVVRIWRMPDEED